MPRLGTFAETSCWRGTQMVFQYSFRTRGSSNFQGISNSGNNVSSANKEVLQTREMHFKGASPSRHKYTVGMYNYRPWCFQTLMAIQRQGRVLKRNHCHTAIRSTDPYGNRSFLASTPIPKPRIARPYAQNIWSPTTANGVKFCLPVDQNWAFEEVWWLSLIGVVGGPNPLEKVAVGNAVIVASKAIEHRNYLTEDFHIVLVKQRPVRLKKIWRYFFSVPSQAFSGYSAIVLTDSCPTAPCTYTRDERPGTLSHRIASPEAFSTALPFSYISALLSSSLETLSLKPLFKECKSS